MTGDIKCGRCGRRLSSSGREIGLMIYEPDRMKWMPVCATARCSGIFMDTKVSELQNYWLNKEGR